MRFTNGSGGVLPLTLDIPEKAASEIRRATAQVKTRAGIAAADVFTARLADALLELCDDLAWRLATRNNLPVPDETISLLFSRPAFLHYVTTTKSGKRARRSFAGTWRVYYALNDTNGDGATNTLTILLFLHSAARLPTIEDDVLND